jgi:hypothetical protein
MICAFPFKRRIWKFRPAHGNYTIDFKTKNKLIDLVMSFNKVSTRSTQVLQPSSLLTLAK